jgi:hypothetical protein
VIAAGSSEDLGFSCDFPLGYRLEGVRKPGEGNRGRLKWILAAADFRRWLFRIGDGCWALARRRGSSRIWREHSQLADPFLQYREGGKHVP